MHHFDNGSELSGLGIQHQVSLDKHQRMIHATLEWQRLGRLIGEEPKPAAISPLHLVWVTLIAFLLHR